MDPMIIAAAAVLVIGAVATAAVKIIAQLQTIHHLVDGTASKLAAETKAATDELKTEFKTTLRELHATVAHLQSQRVTDAQQSTAQAQAAQPPAAQVPPVVSKQVVETQVVQSQTIKKGT